MSYVSRICYITLCIVSIPHLIYTTQNHTPHTETETQGHNTYTKHVGAFALGATSESARFLTSLGARTALMYGSNINITYDNSTTKEIYNLENGINAASGFITTRIWNYYAKRIFNKLSSQRTQDLTHTWAYKLGRVWGIISTAIGSGLISVELNERDKLDFTTADKCCSLSLYNMLGTLASFSIEFDGRNVRICGVPINNTFTKQNTSSQ